METTEITKNEDVQNKVFTIPNILTFLRILLIPVIVFLYIGLKNYVWASIVVLFSGITDVVDGVIARKCNMVTRLGKIIDPIADKLTQITVMFCLVFRFNLMILPLVLLVAKELVAGIVGLLLIKRKNKIPPALWYGKLSTVSLYITMVLHLFWIDIPELVSSITILLCSVFILTAFILYSILNIRTLNLNEEKAQ